MDETPAGTGRAWTALRPLGRAAGAAAPGIAGAAAGWWWLTGGLDAGGVAFLVAFAAVAAGLALVDPPRKRPGRGAGTT